MNNKYGYMPCPDCQTRVLVRTNERGTLSARCDECDETNYAKKGTGKHARWEAKISDRIGTPTPKPTPTPTPTPKPTPTPAPKKGGVFDDIV